MLIEKGFVLNLSAQLIFNSFTLYIYGNIEVWTVSSLTLKLETIVYTSMYSVLTLLCTNGGHVTDQVKVIYL